MQARTAVVGMVLAGGLLVGCGDSVTYTASGKFDEVKYSAAKYKKVTKIITDYKNVCTTKTKKVKHTSGTGKNKRSWTTTDSYQDCNKVRSGSHSETSNKKVKDAKYCVELDGWKDSDDDMHDDVWFNVSPSTYQDYVGMKEGTAVKDMEYNHRSC